MNNSFIKKIVSIQEIEEISKDLSLLFKEDNLKNYHALGLQMQPELIAKSLSHEALLIWNFHVWGHFNGEKWDGIFIGTIRKSERFCKKVMEEYLWISKNSNSGIRLYKTAIDFAKKNGCDYISMGLTPNHPSASKLRKFYFSQGYELDTEIYFKKL